VIPYGKHDVKLNEALKVAFQIRFRSLTQGSKIDEFEKLVAEMVGAKYAVAVSSATAGLHIAMLALDLKSSSKIITSPISFVASSNSIIYAGHKPVFVDIDRDSLNLDLNLVEQKINADPIIHAVLPVHFAGLPCDMKKLRDITQSRNVKIVEDAAHALGALYPSGEKVGSCAYSDMTVFSFHPVKSITTGEGGMVTTNDYSLYKKLMRLRSHGINKLDDDFQNSILSKTSGVTNPWYYEMKELGFNFRLTEIQAVLGISQMKRLAKFVDKRTKLVKNYRNLLEFNPKIAPAQVCSIYGSAHHIFPIRIKFSSGTKSRNEIMAILKKNGIGSQVHYLPIPAHPYYTELGFFIGEIPEAFAYYEEALTIPLFPSLKKREQQRIISILEKSI
jgi:perosamine synthetase